jgi:hypothetical protein
MNWKKHLHKQNAKAFSWPAGWDTAEIIAEQLECSPERVREHLAPSIRNGEVEVKTFTIWDNDTERKISKTGFRMAGKRKQNAEMNPVFQKRKAVTTATPQVGCKIKRVRSLNKEVGAVVSLGKAGMKIEWPSTGVKTHSVLSIRRGDLQIVE